MARNKQTPGPSARKSAATVADGLARSRLTKPAASARPSRATELERPARRTELGVARPRRATNVAITPSRRASVTPRTRAKPGLSIAPTMQLPVVRHVAAAVPQQRRGATRKPSIAPTTRLPVVRSAARAATAQLPVTRKPSRVATTQLPVTRKPSRVATTQLPVTRSGEPKRRRAASGDRSLATTQPAITRASADATAERSGPATRRPRRAAAVHATIPPVAHLLARFAAAIPERVTGPERDQGMALVAAIGAAPADDAALLVFADWLTEHGEPLGELLHVHVALARATDDEIDKLERWERRLLRDHEAAIAGVFHDPALRWRYERGIPAALGHIGVFRAPPPSDGKNAMYLQFLPTNVVHMCWEDASSKPGHLVASIDSSGKGTYRIAGLSSDGSANLVFTIVFGTDAKVDYNLTLQKAALSGDIHSHINGWRHTTHWELIYTDKKALDSRAKLPPRRGAVAPTVKP